MDNTIIQQGQFTATGSAVTLNIRSDFDWIKAYNFTAIDDATLSRGVVYYWQRGMTNGRGIFTTKLGAVANDPLTMGQIAANAGFFVQDSSAQTPSAPVALTASANATSNATNPVVLTGNTSGLVVGSIVRLSGVTVATQLNGIDWQIDNVTANTNFRIRGPFAAAMVAGTAGGTIATGAYRIIPYNPIFYPRRRWIVNISQATSAVVTTSVDHGYTVGQEVRFSTDTLNGMTEINGLTGTITAVTASTFTVNIDSSAFTAFTFPVTANPGAYTPAQVVPVGEDTAQALTSGTNILADATLNTGFIGVTLAAGANSPAGQTAAQSTLATNDVIYWVAGKSFSVENT